MIKMDIEVKIDLKTATKEMKAAAQKGIEMGARLIETEVKKRIMRGAKTGTTYYRIPGEKYMVVHAGSEDGPPAAIFKATGKQNLSVKHTASAPGQSPATDTGNLANLIRVDVKQFECAVVSGAKYSEWLEFGTSKISPRPFMFPSYEENKKKVEGLIARLVRGVTD